MKQFFWVCLGSGIGGGGRYLIAEWALVRLGPDLPYGTFAVNLIGSFLIGALMFASAEVAALSPTVRLALTTGVLGGFTTYSNFSFETMRYLQSGAWATAAGNVTITVVVCLLASLFGWTAARWLIG